MEDEHEQREELRRRLNQLLEATLAGEMGRPNQSNRAHVRREGCKLLGLIGPDAKEAAPLIEAEMKRTGSPGARWELKKALVRIKGSP